MHPLRHLLLVTLSASLLGCPPSREDVGDGGGGGDSLQTALIALDPYTGTQYELAYIFLVDADYTCDQVRWDWGLAWWNMSNEVKWVTATAYKGQFVDWESEFRSQYAWNEEGVWDYTTADFFYGAHGLGGYSTGDDDVPPPIDEPFDGGGREQEGVIGNDLVGREDRLVIHSWGADRVTGSIQSEVGGDFWFDAEHCGYMDGGVVGIGGEDGAATAPPDPAVP